MDVIHAYSCILLQATRNSLLPPFILALGPLADVFGSWYLGQLVAKYQDLTAATSMEKVSNPVLIRSVASLASNCGHSQQSSVTICEEMILLSSLVFVGKDKI